MQRLLYTIGRVEIWAVNAYGATVSVAGPAETYRLRYLEIRGPVDSIAAAALAATLPMLHAQLRAELKSGDQAP